jgi:vacuolar-type H+-ATPase subunit H
MISLPELLRRFRRAWVPPGPAYRRVAPPVDVTARLREELQPVLDAIAAIQARAGQIGAEAKQGAKDLLDAASRDADRKLRDAESRAPATRAAAAERARHAVDAELESVDAASRDETQRIDARVKQHLPELLDEIRGCVLKGSGVSA